MKKFQKGFTLIELIFVIVVLTIIVAVAVPNLMGTKTKALASSIKQDVFTITRSIQSYYMVNNSIEKISDAVTIDTSRWEVSNKKAVFKIDTTPCVSIVISDNKIVVTVAKTSTKQCKKIAEFGISDQTLELF